MKFFKFTREGLPIDSEFLHDVVVKKIAAISEAILNISEWYLKEHTRGNLKRILIETGDKILVLSIRGEDGILSIMESNYELGQVYLKDIEKFETWWYHLASNLILLKDRQLTYED